MESILSITLCIWLMLCSLQDVKSKKISLILVLAGFIIPVAGIIIAGNIAVIDRIAGLVLGLLLLLLCPVTGGQIGFGDGLVICITGLSLGFFKNAELLLLALTISAVISGFLIVFRHVGRHKTIPFIPFMFLAYLGVLVF